MEALVEVLVRVRVSKRPHLLGVLEPERSDLPQILPVEDVEATDAGHPLVERLVDEVTRKPRGNAIQV